MLGALPTAPRGSIRFWGDWFGRPGDSEYRVMSCRADGDALLLVFEGGETLRVHAPERLTLEGHGFRIRDAERVRFEWQYYGREPTPANLCFLEYVASPRGVSLTTNFPGGRDPSSDLIRSEDAVILL